MTGVEQWPSEATRDQTESSLTPILRDVWSTGPGVLAVVFVDYDGECVDYCSTLPPYDAKVLAAHMAILVAEVVERWARLGFGEPHELMVVAGEREILVRRVDEQYALVLGVAAGALGRRVLRKVELCVRSLRRECELSSAPWEPVVPTVEVEVREAVGWNYAPCSFSEGGPPVRVTDVMGRWADEDEGLVCFRVRTEDAREVTLAYDAELARWTRLRE